MIRTPTLAALAAALIAPASHRPAGHGRPPPREAAVNDSLFAMAAADGGLTEVTLAELGVQKATDPELKKFSQQMIAEHTKMNGELTALADAKGMALPEDDRPATEFCAQSLAGLSGEEFDRCYAKAQLVAPHGLGRQVRGRGRAGPGPRREGPRRQGPAAHQGAPRRSSRSP